MCAARLVKWLPNSMLIDPASEKCLAYYSMLKQLDLVLLSHTGEEHSVDLAGCDQALGERERSGMCGVIGLGGSHCHPLSSSS